MNALFLTGVIVLLISSIIAFLSQIEEIPFWNLTSKIASFIFLISLFTLPFAVKNWEKESSIQEGLLNSAGIQYTTGFVPYNQPVVRRIVVIDDNKDFEYYELINK